MTGPPEMPPHKKMPDAARPPALGTSIAEGMPSEVAAYLVAIAIRDRSLAYCQVTPDGDLISWGGALATYGLQSLAVGTSVSEHLFFLEGFFPLAEPHEVLSSVQAPQGLTMDVHLLLSSDGSPAVAAGELPANAPKQAAQAGYPPSCGWILLLDATVETQRQQQLQQKGNDLSLLRSQYAKLLRRTEQSGLMPSPTLLTESDASGAAQPAQSPDPQISQQPVVGTLSAQPDPKLSLRSQQDVSVLIIDLYDLIQTSSAPPPTAQPSSGQTLGQTSGQTSGQTLGQTLGQTPLDQTSSSQPPVSEASVKGESPASRTYFDRSIAAFSLIAQFVIEEGGVVNHVLGTTMVALFGVMPSLQPSAQQALSAANKLLRHYAKQSEKADPPGKTESSENVRSHRIGMAITTGIADTGLVYIHGLQMINAVGPHIKKAFVLSRRSRPDTLVVDQTTLQSWKDNWEENWPYFREKNCKKAENPLKSALCSQILTTHHDYPDFCSQSLELYELTLAMPVGDLNRRNTFSGIDPTLL